MASPETPVLEAKDEAEAFIVQPQSPNPSVEYAEVEAAVQGQKCRDSQVSDCIFQFVRVRT